MAASGKTAQAKTTQSAPSGMAKLLRLLGITDEDVLGYGTHTITVTTKAGGKYRLGADGNSIVHLAGPVLPKSKTAEDAEE